jgi:hypothetical protein
MRIRIQNSNKFIDVNVEHPYLLSNPDVNERELKPKLMDVINRDNLKCDGCGKPLINRGWICVNHRPKSALNMKETYRVEDDNTGEVYGSGEWELKNTWALFLFCSDTAGDCLVAYFDEEMNTAQEEFNKMLPLDQRYKKRKNEDRETLAHYRNYFRELLKLIKRVDYFKGVVYGEGSDEIIEENIEGEENVN